MVIACEMLNRRDMAIKWAKKTVADYKYPISKKRASEYLSALVPSDYTVTRQVIATRENQ